MSPALTAIRDDLRQYITTHSPEAGAIELDTDLLGTGILDSLLVMDLVSHVEKTHGVTLGDHDITPEHFRAVEPLANLIAARLNGA